MPAAGGIERVVQLIEPTALRRGVQTLRGQCLVLGQRLTLMRQSGGDDLRDRLAAEQHDVLRQMGHPGARFDPKAAGIGLGLMAHQPQQRGLAFAVASDEADVLAFIEPQRYLVEQGPRAVGERHFI